MRLQKKVLTIVGSVFIGFCLAVLAVGQFLVLPSYYRIEQNNLDHNWLRAKDAINGFVEALHDRSSDWSSWDEAYFFAKDKQFNFFEKNAPKDTLERMKVDAFIITDVSGEVISSKLTRRFPHLSVPPTDRLLDTLITANTEPPAKGDQVDYSGLVRVDGNIMAVSIRSIHRTDGSGESVGWMIWGRWLDPQTIRKISYQTQLNIELSSDMSLDSASGSEAVLEESHYSISQSNVIMGIYESPVAVMKVTQGRTLVEQGKRTVGLLVLTILSAAALILCFVSFALNKMVVSPIKILKGQVSLVELGNHPEKIQISSGDEFAELANAMNSMLERIEDDAAELEIHRASTEVVNARLTQVNHVLQYALDGIAELSPEGYFYSANARCLAIFNESRLVGQELGEFLAGDSRESLALRFPELANGERVNVVLQCFRKDSRKIHLHSVFVPEMGENGALSRIHAFFSDVTEEKRLSSQLAYQAYHDRLTGLPNRGFLEKRLAELDSKADAVGVMLIDVDDFKYVNDSYGHEFGDKLLREIASRLHGSVDEGDIVVRMGGDEFTILMTNVEDPTRADRVASKILEWTNKPMQVGDKEIYVSCSLGFATSFDTMPQEIIRNADTAMYSAKNAGKGRFAKYDFTMHEKVLERVKLEEGLRTALNRQEMSLVYQPLVSIEDNRLIGAEALLRWNSRELGFVSPVRFIPVAEETGLIQQIGSWVLEEACSQAAAWIQRYQVPFTININLSQRQLRTPGLVSYVKDVLERTGLPASSLNLEITETLAMVELDYALTILNALRETGVKLSIDDFGTGYSSLSYLQKLPVDCVKIDRSFVNSIGLESGPNAIILAIIALCQEMNFKVAGEGVETQEQLEWLQKVGCNIAQGYLFSRPVPSADFEKLLADQLPFELPMAA